MLLKRLFFLKFTPPTLIFGLILWYHICVTKLDRRYDMIKLCVFDLDGTTVNSLNSIAYFANETLKRFGLRTFSVDEYRTLAGGGAKKLIRNLVNATGADESLYEPMLNDWVTSYDNDFLYLTEPYDGVSEMLGALRQKGIHTAIVTNKHGPTGKKICDTLFGTDGELLEVCVSAYPGMVLKPAPDEILKLMDRYGVGKNECMYCGDHTIDMVTGKSAGVLTVGVLWGFHTEEALRAAGADAIAKHPSDIVALAENGALNASYDEQ